MIFLRGLHFLAKRYYSRRYKNIYIKDENRDLFEGEKKKDIVWPSGARAAFNLQFDDFCVKTKENNPYEYAGPYVNALFDEFLRKHPKVKVTLFVVPVGNFKNWKGIFYGEYRDDETFNLASPKYQNIVHWLKRRSDQIEIASHGYNHFQGKVPYFLGAAEFEFRDKLECKNRIEKGLEIFQKSGLPIYGFRPPAWGIGYNPRAAISNSKFLISKQEQKENNNFALIETLKDFDFQYIAASSPLSGLNWDQKRVSNVYPQYYEGLLNIPQNISILWPMARIKNTLDKIVEMNGLITIMGHYSEQDNWQADGIGKGNLEKIEKILAYLEQKYPGQIWHAKLNEIAAFWRSNYPQAQ